MCSTRGSARRGHFVSRILAIVVCGHLALSGCAREREIDVASSPEPTAAREKKSVEEVVAEAVSAIPSLPPAELDDAPASLVRALESRGCVVPQAHDSFELRGEVTNVVRGELSAPGQSDWAALCKKDDATSIVVAWGGKPACSEKELYTISTVETSRTVQIYEGGGRRFGLFSRALFTGLPDGVDPPPPTGIRDDRSEQIIKYYYCVDGEWKQAEWSH